MINSVTIVGRLTKDPEMRYTPNGVAVTNFTLACQRPFKNQNGDREADFIRVVVWRKQAENAAQYLKKGSMAGVNGRLQTRSFENAEGKQTYVTEVVADQVQFLDSRGSNNGSNDGSKNSQNNDPFGGTPDIDDSDLPF